MFVLPSKYEPFGMTVLEAMGCGTPVVATGYGGLRHVLTDRKDSLLVDLDEKLSVTPNSIYYKCGWSPFIGHTFTGKVTSTIVSGHLAWHNGHLDESLMGRRMAFDRRG